MRRYYLFVSILYSFIVFGQGGKNPAITKDLPTVVPPAPTVAALMKFEETPVNNYTGIPDVTIPLYNSPTLSKDINLNISLKYHSGSNAVDEKASDVGLGWSLFAGGSISRTVRGLPDEILKSINDEDKTKVGIYQAESGNFKNPYYRFVRIADSVANVGSFVPNYNQVELRKRFLYESNEKGKFDTEHDLWQFNFMGNSGRFIIEKNSAGLLEVKPLDDYRLKIVNIYGNSTNPYVPISFEIYDEKGYKYIFDITETTSTRNFNTRQFNILSPSSNYSDPYSYISAFHLSKIYDNNQNLLVDLQYSESTKEVALDKSETNSIPLNFNISEYLVNSGYFTSNCGESEIMSKMEPTSLISINERDTNVRKLATILVQGICKIHFNFQTPREDSNLSFPNLSRMLDGITIATWTDEEFKGIELKHNYSTVVDRRLMLEKVSFKNFKDNKVEEYELSYRNNPNAYGVGFVKKDLWGYPKIPLFNGDDKREVNPDFCTIETLQKMTLPTGGCVIFDFEPNTYSYIGDIPVTDFSDNPGNYDYQIDAVTYPTTAGSTLNDGLYTSIFTLDHTQDVYLSSTLVTSDASVRDYAFKVFKLVGSSYVPVANIGLLSYGNSSNNQTGVLRNLTSGTYYVTLDTPDKDLDDVFTSATLTYNYKVLNSNNYQFLYGGGNRIKKIGYFTDNVSQDIYQGSSSIVPAKEKHFDYGFFSNPSKTSGALVSLKPLYEYEISRRPCVECDGQGDSSEYQYTVMTSSNWLPPIKTSGADVGYKNVSVYETGNGKTEYTYSSPIDYSLVENISYIHPFQVITDEEDFKRGQLQSEEVYDKNYRKLKETLYNYTYESYKQRVGVRTKYYGITSCPISGKYKTYQQYRDYVRHCSQNASNPEYTPATTQLIYVYHCPNDGTSGCVNKFCFCYCGEPDDFIDFDFVYEAYGWSKLSSKTTKDYFYEPGNSTANIVQTDETYIYNPINKQISESTVTNSKGEVLKTDYFYHTGDAPGHQNRISEIERIEQYNGNDLLSKSKIVYDDTYSGNAAYLPKSIQTLKVSNEPESRVYYSAYDSYGHPTELQQANGTTISYIWGYNKSQPIAKVENATNAQIAAATGINFNDLKESNIAAINNLRVTLPNAMTTTYTYIPLVGIETMTDPRGYTTTYEYDNFGRLARVRDAEGNILSENEYHYRTQN